ncbi:hypothetical protein ACJIZ3_002470 [Penstemon smallii]|uniref:Uncharacterized protein n=1 Tax=Penstemon smallii TaxID=265156 RepID=A0ABD3U7N4_9LAMI
MLGAIHLGLIAACVVLFVPMGMAGWHLSRNKMLFFSCALFITLAVGVHLMPYFPSIPDFISQSEVISATPTVISRDSCFFSLHDVMYTDVKECEDGPFDSNISNGSFDCNKMKSWEWIKTGSVAECEFQKLKKSDASDLLNGSWVVVAGDSQARLMVVSLLELVMGSEGMESVRGDLFKRHSDYSVLVDEIGLKLDFIWAPYVKNLTELVIRLRRERSVPDVMVMGAGLWDMLHVNNVSDYGVSLRMLRDSSLALLPVSSNLDTRDAGIESKSNRFLHLFWIGMPTLITSMLNTEEKKEKMTSVMSSAYDTEVNESKLLRHSGGPLLKLDIRLLSGLCGPQCTADGMHYDGVVYDSAVHILLNALLIESNQRPHLILFKLSKRNVIVIIQSWWYCLGLDIKLLNGKAGFLYSRSDIEYFVTLSSLKDENGKCMEEFDSFRLPLPLPLPLPCIRYYLISMNLDVLFASKNKSTKVVFFYLIFLLFLLLGTYQQTKMFVLVIEMA